ncbi:M56 family metallopeptidase [Hymenobacter yonginensis]|uniref:TonB-dependent receptor plug domain-containing protein n=1 Tax=Hymenobacter yonginensis TaxID=748197 RepID=A0ABY7PLX8_9BACT|nr:M56 family metallopeptidase [Hymenobacter yonginensis]WBO83982.1 TonB-dependent receptor plug domain-containing protein [Hymenobacter yonginensis]
MPALLLYLLQMQLALLLLLAVYYGLLRRLTFHQLNRGYLLAALALAAVYPVLDLGWLRPAVAPAAPLMQVVPAWTEATGTAAPAASGPEYGAWLLAAYGLGAAGLLLRLLVQGASLWRLHRASRPVEAAGVRFRAVAGEVSPFSFGRAIYLNPAHHAPAELPVALLHEQVHVRQAHTLDVLLGHLHRVLAWASPAAWLWLRATQENLEFIADAAVLRESQLAPKQYQYSLVRLSTLAAGSPLTTPFSFITLKNRIRMMNSLPSGRRQLLRYAAVLPIALGLLLTAAATQATPAVATSTLADTEKPAPISALPPAALRHIVQQYPGYRLIGVSEVRAADGTNLRYKAEIAIGRRPENVLFDAQGQPVVVAEPIYFLDGERIEKKALDNLNPATIESMNVVKGAATATFGPEASNGVILVFTKQNRNSAEVLAFMKTHSIVLQPASGADARLMENAKQGKPLTAADLNGRLLMVDGREVSPADVQLTPDKLESVFVLDAEHAVKKYGEKGRQGAIVIITK